MLTFIRYKMEILLEYNADLDCYELNTDDLYGFPYESFEFFELQGIACQELFLDQKEDYPTAKADIWCPDADLVTFIAAYTSRTIKGKAAMQALKTLVQAYCEVRC